MNQIAGHAKVDCAPVVGGKIRFSFFLVISAHWMLTKVRDLIVSLSLGKVGRCANSKKTMASETGTMAADSVQMR